MFAPAAVAATLLVVVAFAARPEPADSAQPEATVTSGTPGAGTPAVAPAAPQLPEPAEVRVPEGEPEPVDPATLPHPGLDAILPDTLPVADGVTGLAASPHHPATVGYAAPDGEPVIALASDELGLPARWAVTDQQQGWVQIAVPFGRGALASVDPARTNHVAAWVRSSDVDVTAADTYVLDLSDRTLTGPEGTVPVGVGKESTPTPTGPCAVVGHVYDPHVGDALLTSCQSEAMDEYQAGTGYAAIAMHADPEGGRAVGQARSNGCIRMRSQDFRVLLEAAQPGDMLSIVE